MRASPVRLGANEGVTLGQAALIVGLAYLFNPVSYAEFQLYPKLVIPGHIPVTVANLSAHHGQLPAVLACFTINFIEDITIAWGLYLLLAPVCYLGEAPSHHPLERLKRRDPRRQPRAFS